MKECVIEKGPKFGVVTDVERILECEKCETVRPHTFVGISHTVFYFKDQFGVEQNGSGPKEIWKCNCCLKPRIYGAPDLEAK